MNNQQLLAGCRWGDPVAWETLIERYRRLVYSIPHRAGLDEDRAAEVFQRVFEKLVINLEHIEQPERLGAWLATTARRETWRLNQGETTSHCPGNGETGEEQLNQLPCNKLLPEEALLRREESYAVRQAVAALDDRCRCLIDLLFYRPDPLPYAQVASTLEMAEGSIGPNRARCLQKLRSLLDNLGLYCCLDLEYSSSIKLTLDGLALL